MGFGLAMLGGGLISGGLSYLGSKSQSDAAKSAARAGVSAEQANLDLQRRMWEVGRSDVAPWKEAGEEALKNLRREEETYRTAIRWPNTYRESPGFGWLQEQGIEALNRGASASGELDSGARSKDLLAYGQGLALQDYTGYLGRLETLMNRYAGTAGMGQTASGQLASMGQNYASNAGSALSSMGQAQAGGYINQANARTGLYNNLSNIASTGVNQYMLNNYLQNLGGGSFGASGFGSAGASASGFGNIAV